MCFFLIPKVGTNIYTFIHCGRVKTHMESGIYMHKAGGQGPHNIRMVPILFHLSLLSLGRRPKAFNSTSI